MQKHNDSRPFIPLLPNIAPGVEGPVIQMSCETAKVNINDRGGALMAYRPGAAIEAAHLSAPACDLMEGGLGI